MWKEEYLAILRQGAEVWNKWREENRDIKLSLRGESLRDLNLEGAHLDEVDFHETSFVGANLTGVWLQKANLEFTNFTGADLTKAYLDNAILHYSNLSDSSLHEASLREVNLLSAKLCRADLRGAILSWTNLDQADLTGANFAQANLGGTILGNVNLSNVLGLDSVIHQGSSTLGIDTLIKSKGKIPESFLRGCGVPDSFIEYLPSLIGAMEPIQFYSCFISYSTKNEEFAKRLHSRMRDNNLRVWIANEDLKGGHKLHEQIDEAIRVYDKFIIVLSPESLRSKWVMTEVRRTRKAELANNQRKFFPIALLPYKELEDWECIDPETGTDLAAEIREYFIPDFRGWKNHNKFEKAFAQLLEGLKAVDAPPAPRIEAKDGTAPDPNVSKRRRLRILEDQQARMGVQTPPHVIMEIEDLRKELEGS